MRDIIGNLLARTPPVICDIGYTTIVLGTRVRDMSYSISAVRGDTEHRH